MHKEDVALVCLSCGAALETPEKPTKCNGCGLVVVVTEAGIAIFRDFESMHKILQAKFD